MLYTPLHHLQDEVAAMELIKAGARDVRGEIPIELKEIVNTSRELSGETTDTVFDVAEYLSDNWVLSVKEEDYITEEDAPPITEEDVPPILSIDDRRVPSQSNFVVNSPDFVASSSVQRVNRLLGHFIRIPSSSACGV